MKKMLIALILALALTACGETQQEQETTKAKTTVKIGVTLPLSGNLAYAGQGMKASLEVFQEDLAKRELKNSYQFIFEDNAWDIKRVPSIMAKFFSIDKVDAVLDFGSSIGQVSSPLSEQYKVVHFNACASDASIAEGKYNFLHTTLPYDEAKILSKKIKGKYNKVVVIGQNDVSSQVTVAEVVRSFSENGISYETFFMNPDERNMRLLIEKTKLVNPDLYVVILYSPTLEIFTKQFNEAGVSIPMMSTHFFANIADYELIEGATFADYAVMEKGLKQRVLDKTPNSNYEMCIGYIYDVADILVESFENQPDKTQVVDYIANLTTRKGVVGETTQNEEGVFTAPASFKQITNGKPVLVED